MGLKLTTKARPFAPDVDLPTTVGRIPNRDVEALSKADVSPVLCDVELAGIDEKQRYYSTETTTSGKGKNTQIQNSGIIIRYLAAVRKHCKSIEGLEEFGIKTGRDLTEYRAPKGEHRHPVIDEIIQEIFLYATGGHIDSNSEEMTEKE
jgi:hypothetical protein